MIVRMTKYSFVVLSQELDSFLLKLQELGMMDITRSVRPVDQNSREMVELSTRYKASINMLKRVAKECEGITPVETPTTDDLLLQNVEKVFAAKDEATAAKNQLLRDIQESEVWGEFSHKDIERLQQIGLQPHFYAVSPKRYQESWKEEYPLQILNATANKIYFTIVAPTGEEVPFPIQEATFPAQPASILRGELKEIEAKIDNLKGQIAYFVNETDRLQSIHEAHLGKLDLYLANVASVKEGEDTISVLEGFAPTTEDGAICEFLDSTSALYITEKATQEDNPPVKLKNNWFARAFEPIGSLYVLPKYDELDLTPFYAPFYMLFFGLCLGDMGYGLVLTIVGLVAMFALPKFKGYGQLVFWLGIGSLVMPLLSGTFFGMKLAEIIPSMPEDIKGLFFSDLKMFWFAIIFGIFQIVFAKVMRGIDCLRRKLWDNALTNFGWALVVTWCAFAYASMEMNTQLLHPTVSKVMGLTGLVLVLFCSKPTKFFLLRPVMGIISLYDITGFFGDVLSYIRLFGLGTTGGILALVINSISMQLSGIPYIGWGLTVIMLIIGHIAVMGLSILGAFVHPVRLTFVEFYKNAEFEGGGREYKPLKK
ncbi:MAG: hypothetical protein J6U80_00520 [Bacteroidales bacterium]|nr:hypothetical protein [Bacteroidales bacterium]